MNTQREMRVYEGKMMDHCNAMVEAILEHWWLYYRPTVEYPTESGFMEYLQQQEKTLSAMDRTEDMDKCLAQLRAIITLAR